MRSQKHHKEKEYLHYLQTETISEINSMIIKMKKFITELDMLLTKSERDIIRSYSFN